MNQQSTDRPDNEKPDDVLERAIASIQEETIPSGPSTELMFATYQALHNSEKPLTRSVSLISRTKIMKFVATAAALLLAVSLATLLPQAIKSPSLSLAQPAFGQALKQVREARSMSYAESITMKEKQLSVSTKVFIAEDGRRRSEMPGLEMSGGIVTIFDANGFVRLTLIKDTKTAIVFEKREDNGINAGKMFLTWLKALKKLGDEPDKELERKEIDGKQVTGFVATQGNFTFTMWVDDATQEMVQIEYDPQTNDPISHVVMNDFRFDEKLDESLFSFAVPAGYKVREQPAMPSVPGGEKSVLEALRGYTKRDDGRFPSSLTDWGRWAVLFSKGSKDGKLDPETTKAMSHLGAVLPFLTSMSKADYAYLGEGKTTEQKDAIVFWYKKPDGTYRAIFGDLSVKDIAPEDLPKK